jgi:hypothetical protein
MSPAEYEGFLDAVNLCTIDLVLMQHTGETDAAGNWKSFGDIWAVEIAARLPAEVLGDPGFRTAFCRGDDYELGKIMAVGLGAVYADDRRQFDSLAGFHDKGTGQTRTLRGAFLHGYWEESELGPPKKDVITLNDLHKAVRRLYYQVVEFIDDVPYPPGLVSLLEPGTYNVYETTKEISNA